MKKTDGELRARLDQIANRQEQIIDKQDKVAEDIDWRTSKSVSLDY
jgi:hypothetical protein